MTQPIRSMPELIDALRARAHELQITHETIDAVSGLQSGYTSKLFAPVPIKNLGPVSFSAVLGALGLAVVVVEDPEQVKRVESRWTKRQKPLVEKPMLGTPSIEHQVPQEIPVTPALQRLLNNPNWMREIGQKGAQAYRSKVSPKRRAKIARKAAKARWRKRRRAQRTKTKSGSKTAAGFTDLASKPAARHAA